MRERFWVLGQVHPAGEAAALEHVAAHEPDAFHRRTDDAPRAPRKGVKDPRSSHPSTTLEPSAWIATLEAHAALGHGAFPRRFFARR
jgi:hypothetical protein